MDLNRELFVSLEFEVYFDFLLLDLSLLFSVSKRLNIRWNMRFEAWEV